MSGILAVAQLYEKDGRISPLLFTSLRASISLEGKASRSLLRSLKRTCVANFENIDSFTAPLGNLKKKSPEMAEKVEELKYNERMRKNDFYVNVKNSLLNLLEFSETKLNLDLMGEIFATVADIASSARFFKDSEMFKKKNFYIYQREDIPKHSVLRVHALNRLASHFIYKDEDLDAAYQLMKNEPEAVLDSYFKAWADKNLEDKGAVVTHYRRLCKLFNFLTLYNKPFKVNFHVEDRKFVNIMSCWHVFLNFYPLQYVVRNDFQSGHNILFCLTVTIILCHLVTNFIGVVCHHNFNTVSQGQSHQCSLLVPLLSSQVSALYLSKAACISCWT